LDRGNFGRGSGLYDNKDVIQLDPRSLRGRELKRCTGNGHQGRE
jgi:hypothetical protein